MISKPTKTYTLQAPITTTLRDRIDAVAIDREWSRAQGARWLIERGLETVEVTAEVEAAA